jgi:hypothetical protein
MNCIIRDYSNLNSRVEGDVAVQRKQDEQEKKERLERIRKAREERDEGVADGIIANGICNTEMDDGGDSDVVEADPFKPLADIMVSFLFGLERFRFNFRLLRNHFTTDLTA